MNDLIEHLNFTSPYSEENYTHSMTTSILLHVKKSLPRITFSSWFSLLCLLIYTHHAIHSKENTRHEWRIRERHLSLKVPGAISKPVFTTFSRETRPLVCDGHIHTQCSSVRASGGYLSQQLPLDNFPGEIFECTLLAAPPLNLSPGIFTASNAYTIFSQGAILSFCEYEMNAVIGRLRFAEGRYIVRANNFSLYTRSLDDFYAFCVYVEPEYIYI